MTEVSTVTYFSPKVSGLTKGGGGGGDEFRRAENKKERKREKLNKSFVHLRYTVEIPSDCLLLNYSLGWASLSLKRKWGYRVFHIGQELTADFKIR